MGQKCGESSGRKKAIHRFYEQDRGADKYDIRLNHMKEKFKVPFGQIDDLLEEVEGATGGGHLFAEIDAHCGEINTEDEARRQEVETWPIERKRPEAADSRDPFVLHLLSM